MKILAFCIHLTLAILVYLSWHLFNNGWLAVLAAAGVIWAVYHDLYTPLRRK
jgi:hypothetical protein